LVAVLCALPIVAVGCGNSRTPVPSLTAPSSPHGFRTVNYDRADRISLTVPADWTAVKAKAPLLGTVSSGAATIALWRYQRAKPLARNRASLESALKAIEDAARAKDPSLHEIRSAVTKADGKPAVELDVIERVGSQIRRVRSLHVYSGATELVLEEYAPSALFHSVDHTVFSPVRRSLKFAAASAA
jgi:hypothetical protein